MAMMQDELPEMTEASLRKLTIPKLKDILQGLHLSKTGNKQALIDRLISHHQNPQHQADQQNSDRPRQEKTAFKEPKVKWKRSEAKRLLYKDLKEGTLPLFAMVDNKYTHPRTDQIYQMRPEYQKYDPAKFSSRLASVRKTVRECNDRAAADRVAFDRFKNHNPVSHYSHKGYIQWQGSEAQTLARQDIKDGKVEELGFADLHSLRAEYYTNFPLSVFRDKIRQERRTAKYLHTLEMKGKQQGRKK